MKQLTTKELVDKIIEQEVTISVLTSSNETALNKIITLKLENDKLREKLENVTRTLAAIREQELRLFNSIQNS